MQIRVEARDQCSILHLKGEFDSFQCKPFLARFEELLDQGMKDAALNLLKVKFMNSTALGTLIKASKICKREGGRLVISAPSAFCRKTIESVGLQAVLPIFETDDAAEQHFAGETEAPDSGGDQVFTEDESAVLFFPTDESRLARFLPEDQLVKKATNPIHGHAFGSTWRGVGRMSALEENGVRFTWDGGNTGLTAERMGEMLETEVELRIKFRLPLMQRQLSEATVTVDNVETRDDGVKVMASFTEIGAKTLESVQRYVKDIAYLKKELNPGEQGAGG